MSNSEFVHDTRAPFRIVGPPVTEHEINAVFSTSFPGKGVLVQFYLRHNGGCRTLKGGVFTCGAPGQRITHDSLENLRIEGFYSISLDPQERMLPVRSMLRSYATYKRVFAEVPEMATFLDAHLPIAWDHTGDMCLIDTATGAVRLWLVRTWREGAIEVAKDFSEFVSRYWTVDTVSDGMLKHLASCGVYADCPYSDGVQQFERATGLKYDTPEAVAYCKQKNSNEKDDQ